MAKVEWHAGELYPRVGFIVTDLARPAEHVVTFYNQRGTAEQLAYNVGNFMRTLAMPKGGGAMVTDEPMGEADQDWREGRQPWQLRDVPDGRGRRFAAHVQGHPDAYCPASGAANTSVRGSGIKCDKQRRGAP